MKQNSILNYVQQAIDYIEEHIMEVIDATSIAKAISISVSYLKKIFKAVTDVSIMEYARARKLNHCLHLLATTKLSISTIALQYGYEYEQSFSRAFKQNFGISPKHYREASTVIDLTPKMDLSFVIELKDAVIAKPVFKKLPSFKLGGLIHRVSFKEKFQYKPSELAKDFHFNKKQILGLDFQDYYGYTLPDPELPESTYYMTGSKINENVVLPEGFKSLQVPEQTYIVFKFIGNFDPSYITWEHLLSIWSYRDKYLEQVHGIKNKIYGYFEYINASICSDSYCELELYVPINL